MTAPGWYPDPSGAPGQRYWDGARWCDHTAALRQSTKARTSWIAWVLLGSAVALGIGYSAWGFFDQTRLVRDTTSSNPNIEAFYRDLDAQGFGDMRKSDALKYAKDVCDSGDGLILWTDAHRSMADSFKFATAALRVCHDL